MGVTCTDVSRALADCARWPAGPPSAATATAARHDRSRRHYAGRSAVIVARETQPRQVDGDVVDEGRRLEARVRPAALVVRVPR